MATIFCCFYPHQLCFGDIRQMALAYGKSISARVSLAVSGAAGRANAWLCRRASTFSGSTLTVKVQ